MAEHPNVDFIRRAFDTFNAGDVEGLMAIMDENCVQHMGARNAIMTGDHVGRDNVLAMYGRLGEASGGTLDVQPQRIWANDDTVVVEYRETAQRDGKSIDMLNVIVFRLRDGKIVDLTDIPGDADEEDAFWG
jgi:uncharacterized protein